MSLAFQTNDAKQYGTKTEVRNLLLISYGRISEAIRTGQLAVHLIDNKIQIEIAEAKALFRK